MYTAFFCEPFILFNDYILKIIPIIKQEHTQKTIKKHLIKIDKMLCFYSVRYLTIIYFQIENYKD